jgi:hypothetical protein
VGTAQAKISIATAKLARFNMPQRRLQTGPGAIMTKIAAVCTLLCSVAGLATAASTIAASATTLTDGDFASVTVTSSFTSGTATVTTAAPCSPPTCGNPGAALQATVSATSSGTTGVGFIDNLLSYNPSTLGAITSLSASYDRLTQANFVLSIPITFRLLIAQDGIDYVTAITLSGTDTGGSFHTLSVSNLLATNFSEINFTTGAINGSVHPNFSGDTILFGVEQLSTLTGGQTITGTFDNFNIGVNTPLPAALPLFATGLGGLGLLSWRRKRKAQAA